MSSATILLVEDDEGVAELERRRLGRAGYRTCLSTNEQDARRLIAEEKIDLIVLDHLLPGPRSGLAFYEALKNEGCDLPVIIVTGCNQESIAIQALRAGVRDYVSKSIDYLDYLPEAVARVLEQVRTANALRETEAQLRHSQKIEALGRLAGSIAHDFNNFLSVIIGCTEAALDELRDEDPLRQLIQDVYDSGKRAATLTRQLLTFSRRNDYFPEPINLNELLIDIAPMLRRITGIGIDLKFQLAEAECWLFADKGQLDQLLLNLIVNARDAMPLGGSIFVETDLLTSSGQETSQCEGSPTSDSVVRLSVADTGCGMSAETQSRIFEPFFTTKGPSNGTGLGLATVHGVVQQAGGRMKVSSELDHGTSFVIDFPAIADPTIARPPQCLPPISVPMVNSLSLTGDP